MQSCSKSGIVLPFLNPKLLLSYIEPKNVKIVLHDPIWRVAMQKDFDALHKNNTLSLCLQIESLLVANGFLK